MAFKVFLDANVLLDLMLRRDNYAGAKLLIKKVIDGDVKAYTTPSIIHITCNSLDFI
jgi:predicted nucleic acid-binding protein